MSGMPEWKPEKPKKTYEDLEKEIAALLNTDYKKELERLRSANQTLEHENRQLTSQRAELERQVDELKKTNRRLEGRHQDHETEKHSLRSGAAAHFSLLSLVRDLLASINTDFSTKKRTKEMERSIGTRLSQLYTHLSLGLRGAESDYASRGKERLLIDIWKSSPVSRPELDRIMEHFEGYFLDPDNRDEIKAELEKRKKRD